MKILVNVFLLVTTISNSQNFFFEDFNYTDFAEIDSIYDNRPRRGIWSTNFSKIYEDISEDGIEDAEEFFKYSSLIPDPENPQNKVLRLELNKIDPLFYARSFCDDTLSDNRFSDTALDDRYDALRDLYCIGCKLSPQGVFNHYWRNKMNRNEISTYGKGKLYKVNRDYWMGFKLLIDEQYQFEKDKNPELVFQIITASDKAGYPPIELRIVNDEFVLVIFKDSAGTNEEFNLGKVEKNKWTTWKFHVNLSKRDKKGIIEAWKDGQSIYSETGSNLWLRSKFYFKFGIYKWAWWNCSFPPSETQKKVVMLDKIWASKKELN